MRKITQEAFTAWKSGKSFNKSNTRVDENGGVFLHGNQIVRVTENAVLVSDGGWGWSKTTRERLSPWITFSQKNWEPLMDGNPYESGTWVALTRKTW
jgi:hypothetical protein